MKTPEMRTRREWIRSTLAGMTGMAGWSVLGGASSARGATGRLRAEGSAILLKEFLYEAAPFPECHASTVVETRDGILAAWFGGTREGRDDVCIYTSRREKRGWTPPEQVARGVMEGDAREYPCWNPVLFQPRRGPLLLFYKVGPRPTNWWGMLITSTDEGRTWSRPRRLPEGQLGPIRAKPVELPGGDIVCGSSTEHDGWQVQMETVRDPGGAAEWRRTPPLNRGDEWGAIQPTVLVHGRRRLQILCRSRQKVILESWSEDGGATWTGLKATSLPNPNSGIDVVRMRDRRFVMIYNHTERGRSPLNLAISRDGREWEAAEVLENEPGEYSYPAGIQGRDGLLHFTYTWRRQRVRHVVVDPRRLVGRPMVGGQWPA